VIGRTESEINTSKPKQLLPQLVGQNSISVRNQSKWKTMKFIYICYIKILAIDSALNGYLSAKKWLYFVKRLSAKKWLYFVKRSTTTRM
jgi:hypothetical protein